uniref:DML1/Misato tubulin domain-containing protein n=1 Tax=Megaselia scalaris TaxID=36166 RepID=T1GRN5_MEGSC
MEEKEYKLNENVKTWTDFLYSRYHPRSINIVRDYKHSDEKESLDTFSNGKSLWKTDLFEDEFCDRIRQYVEECDFLQGFQNIFDISNGFSGLSMNCMEYLNDEYAKSILAIPVFSPKNVIYENADEAMSNAIRIVNIALTYNGLVENSSMFLPLSLREREWKTPGVSRQFPHLTYKEDNLYQTSAIIASYLDTLSLKYRFKNAASYLPGFCTDMTNYGRKLTAGAFSLPLQMNSEEDLIDCLDRFDGDLFTQISPNTQIGTDYVVQSVFVRGVPKNRLKRPMQSAKLQMRMAAYRCDSVSEMFQLYFQCKNHASLAHVAACPRLLPTLATVQNSGDIADTLETLHREAERIKIKKIHRFRESGFEEDEYGEMLENLLQFKDNYEDNFEL